MNKTNYIEAVAGNAVSVTAGAYQYDRGIKLRVDGTTALSPPNFHFAIDGMENALTAKSTADSSGRLICRIPDTLLMQTAPIHTYIYIENGDDTGYTLCEFVTPVIARAKPSNVTYTPAEIHSFDKLMSELNAAKTSVSELLENTQDAQQVIADGKAVAEKLLEINMELVNGDLYLEMPDTLSKEGTT